MTAVEALVEVKGYDGEEVAEVEEGVDHPVMAGGPGVYLCVERAAVGEVRGGVAGGEVVGADAGGRQALRRGHE